MSEEMVTEALKALRRADASVDTGPEAEIRALLAFRRQQRRRRLVRTAQSFAACGAIAAAVILLSLWPARKNPNTSVAITAPATPTPSIPAADSPSPAPEAPPAQTQEVVTDFFPLMQSPPPLERGLLVRLTVPASTMRSVGLPVADDHLSDPVQADILVGQDDLARAIRFVIRD